MRALSLALLLVCSAPAFAEPLILVLPPGTQTVEGPGVWLNQEAAIELAKDIEATKAERDTYKELAFKNYPGLSLSTVLLIGAGCLVTGAGVALLVTR